MSWKEKRLITILSIILAVLCAAVLVVLSIRYRAAQAAKDQNTVSPSDIAEAAQSEYVALSYSNGSTTLSFSLNEDGVWTWDSEPDFPLDDTQVHSDDFGDPQAPADAGYAGGPVGVRIGCPGCEPDGHSSG